MVAREKADVEVIVVCVNSIPSFNVAIIAPRDERRTVAHRLTKHHRSDLWRSEGIFCTPVVRSE